MTKLKTGSVLILDFGSQYTQLIARRVRENNVFSEILSPDTSLKAIVLKKPKAIILSGGPASVYDKNSPLLPKGIFDCRDHMLISRELKKRGYSKIDVEKVMGLNLIRVRELNESI